MSLIVWYYILEIRIHISCFSRQKQVYTVGHQKHHFNFQTLTDINQIISVEYTAYYLWTIDEHSFICHNFQNINFKIPWISKKIKSIYRSRSGPFIFFKCLAVILTLSYRTAAVHVYTCTCKVQKMLQIWQFQKTLKIYQASCSISVLLYFYF